MSIMFSRFFISLFCLAMIVSVIATPTLKQAIVKRGDATVARRAPKPSSHVHHHDD